MGIPTNPRSQLPGSAACYAAVAATLTKMIADKGRTPVFENADMAAVGDTRRHMILQHASRAKP